MTIHSPKSHRRHETCFRSPDDKSNVKFLRDRITCKLKPHGTTTKGIKITKTVTSPKDTITSTVCAYKDGKVTCKTGVSDHHYSRGTLSSTARRCCRHCSFSVPPKVETPKADSGKRGSSLERTFGTEKRKVDLVLPKVYTDNRFHLMRELKSPTEVKKAQLKTYPPGTIIKKSNAPFCSAKQKSTHKDDKCLDVQVAISPKGREILYPVSISRKTSRSPSASPILSRSRIARASPVPSTTSDRSKSSLKSRSTSVDSLPSPVAKRKIIKPVTVTKTKSSLKEDSDREKKKLKKVKKDLNNEEIKKEKKVKSKEKIKDDKKMKKCAGRSAGSEIVKKLKKMEKSESEPPKQLIKEELIKAKDMVQSESFFQHLFLRDVASPTPSVASKSSWITEKSKIFEEGSYKPISQEPSLSALKIYLSNRKPVSESKFKTIDREIMRSRSVSPSIRNFVQFDSISEVSNEDLADGLAKEARIRRSSSLPVARIVFSEPRSLSPEKYSERHSSPIRSPSYRRIQSGKSSLGSKVEGVSGIKKKVVRARSAGEADSIKRELEEDSLYQSTTSLSHIGDLDEYKSYILETRQSSRKSERFKELNRFYSSLERLGHLERTFSSTDLRPRRKHEDEIIDYDRWMQVRTREKAESEFNSLYRHLKDEQKEKDLLFKTKDVEKFRWDRSRDRGLRVREKSVENIKEEFEKLKHRDYYQEISECRDVLFPKDAYKPLWRGDSVLSLATRMAERRSQSESRILSARQRLLYSERLLTKEIGSRLWSSLSMEQINAIRNQLAEIYSKAPPKRQVLDNTIEVQPVVQRQRPNTLIVRRSSDMTAKKDIKPTPTEKSSPVSKLSAEPLLSESDKKRLSLTLSQEVRDRMSKKQKYKSAASVLLGKETKGTKGTSSTPQVKKSVATTGSQTRKSAEKSKESSKHNKKDDNFLLALTMAPDNNKKAVECPELQLEPSRAIVKRVPSLSETESASSDTSIKTAIFLGNNKDKKVGEKIEYFESGANVEEYIPTVYKPADDNEFESPPASPKERKTTIGQVTSQSYADLKELFGEKELMKFATIPLAASRKETYVYPKAPKLQTSLKREKDNTNAEKRDVSPESEKYWLAYLTYIKGGVRKLAKKFEYLEDFYSGRTTAPYRLSMSDPELTRSQKYDQFGDVHWLTTQYENLGRGRSKIRRSGTLSPIPRHAIRAEDRFMPHINIISKLASLYPKKSRSIKPITFEEWAKSLGCPVGEVEKLREKFDSPTRNMSLLGQMFTSSPDLHELRDIAPYLTGPWIAHKFPKSEDNVRTVIAPHDKVTKDLVKRSTRRPKSASPPRGSVSLASILKPDVFGNQSYDPSVHQPALRYEPASPSSQRGRSWSPKHSVKFKGG